MSETAREDRLRYTRLENVTGAQFEEYALGETKKGEDLREWVISAALNGYPYDFSGFNRNANGGQKVTDSQFRTLTQYAIWYFTDSYTVNNNKLSVAEREIFYNLINTKLSKTVTDSAKSNINLYISDRTKTHMSLNKEKNYQDLLTVETTPDNPLPDNPNTQKSVNLTLAKNVTGTQAKDSFKFTITLTDKSGNPLTGTKSVSSSGAGITSLTFDEKGVAVVNLADKQSVTIKDLPYGTSYSIVEEQNSDYTAKITASSGTAVVSDRTKTISKISMSSNETVTYLNTYVEETIVPPTGVRTDTTPLLIMTGITMAGIVLMVRRRIIKGRWV
jgi:TQXA domain-containing protein